MTDDEVRSSVLEELSKYAAQDGYGTVVVETAGGVLSPSPSGSTQADLYRPFRFPVLLVGDKRLGGISATISAYESLHLRGYDVDSIVLFEDSYYGNLEYLQSYFLKKNIPVTGIPTPPPRAPTPEEDLESMTEYYEKISQGDNVAEMLHHIESKHNDRVLGLEGMARQAHDTIWYPFTQHQGRSPRDILVIESAHGDAFDSLKPAAFRTQSTSDATSFTMDNKSADSVLQPAFDGSASWWTQGLGHGNPELALAAAHAAGRYGHVMFASAIHKPALDLAQNLLRMHENPRLKKVFFSDNGSTGVEVAVKMGLRASCQRYHWDHKADDILVLGLTNSYHGDTIGAMDCSEPSVYNEKEPWYKPRGVWLDFPQVKMIKGEWTVEMPSTMNSAAKTQTFSSLDEIFNLDARTDLMKEYTEHISSVLRGLRDSGKKIGALLMEPVLLGAGGMMMPDPLFQHALVQTVRQYPSLFDKSVKDSTNTNDNWSGLPVIFDEVFAGVYRLGRFAAGSSFLNTYPDIVVNAKLLTGGLLPLCTTSASQPIFDAFLGEEKSDCLLHGHSYTAHPIGCNVAVESLKTMEKLDRDGEWNAFKQSWASSSVASNATIDSPRQAKREPIWSMWSSDFVKDVSNSPPVDHVLAIGSVLAIALKDAHGSGKLQRIYDYFSSHAY